MVLQERDIQTLSALASYFLMSTRQIRTLCYPEDSTGRITRRRLNKMQREGLLRKRTMHVVNPRDGSASPVFHLAPNGREFLAGHFDDERYLLKPYEPSQPQHLFHYLAVTDTHIMLDHAISNQSEVKLDCWFNEDEIVNVDETDSSKRFTLLTEYKKTPKIVCAPDAAFMLTYRGISASFYLEQDRDTLFHKRVAARKSPGYKELFQSRGHRKHFPQSTLEHFFVLVICPTLKRRDQLRKAFALKNENEPTSKIYRFASITDLHPDSLLHESLFSCCHEENLRPLVKKTNAET